jgi:hypothetical protein
VDKGCLAFLFRFTGDGDILTAQLNQIESYGHAGEKELCGRRLDAG